MQSTMSAWRAATDPDDLREYDRFGPWIDVIDEPADMPRRFRPSWPELSTARYLLKVPRPYDRHQVRPGMDLYGVVVAVFADRLCVLRAEPDAVVRRDIARSEVVATVRHSNLLVGRWTLLLADADTVEIEFSSGSLPLIAEIDRYLMANPSPTRRFVEGLPRPAPADHLFRSVIADLDAKADEPVRPIHVEESGQPCRNERGRRRRSAGMMALATSDDLMLVNRDVAAKSLFGRGDYAWNLVRIPLRLVTAFEVRSGRPTSPPSFCQLVVTCDRQEIAQPCLVRPDAVVALLRTLEVPEFSTSG
jgi:hypothetical protein